MSQKVISEMMGTDTKEPTTPRTPSASATMKVIYFGEFIFTSQTKL